jgi:hypothetical protein
MKTAVSHLVKNARKRTRKRRADAQRLHGNHAPDAALRRRTRCDHQPR